MLLILMLILMFFLGVVQVLWAAILAFVTRDKSVRQHLGRYFIGVLIYFLFFIPLSLLKDFEIGHWIIGLHFFGSAAYLAYYHIDIVYMPRSVSAVEKPMVPDFEESDMIGI